MLRMWGCFPFSLDFRRWGIHSLELHKY